MPVPSPSNSPTPSTFDDAPTALADTTDRRALASNGLVVDPNFVAVVAPDGSLRVRRYGWHDSYTPRQAAILRQALG